MIVPDILIASGFIVLACGDAVAVIHLFEGQGNGLREILDPMSMGSREIVEILKVFIGDNQDMPFIVWPPQRSNKSRHQGILSDHIILMGERVVVALKKPTERTDIPRRCVMKHPLPPGNGSEGVGVEKESKALLERIESLGDPGAKEAGQAHVGRAAPGTARPAADFASDDQRTHTPLGQVVVGGNARDGDKDEQLWQKNAPRACRGSAGGRVARHTADRLPTSVVHRRVGAPREPGGACSVYTTDLLYKRVLELPPSWHLPPPCVQVRSWTGIMHGESPLHSEHAFAGSCVSNAGDWQDEH